VRVGEHDLTQEPDCDNQQYCANPAQDFIPVSVLVHQGYNKQHR
jgi:hypothetical protein